MDDNQRQIVRNEETVVAGEPAQTETTVSQTNTQTGAPTTAAATTMPIPEVEQPVGQSTVQTTTATAAPSDRVVAHNVAVTDVDPAAEKASAVDWVKRLVWFIVGLMAALLLIRFGLLAAGANESAGFVQLMYGLTEWMVAPFKGVFGQPFTYPGAAGTAVIEFEALLAAAVYLLVGWLVTKLAELMLGTNRTTSTVYSDTERHTRV